MFFITKRFLRKTAINISYQCQEVLSSCLPFVIWMTMMREERRGGGKGRIETKVTDPKGCDNGYSKTKV